MVGHSLADRGQDKSEGVFFEGEREIVVPKRNPLIIVVFGGPRVRLDEDNPNLGKSGVL